MKFSNIIYLFIITFVFSGSKLENLNLNDEISKNHLMKKRMTQRTIKSKFDSKKTSQVNIIEKRITQKAIESSKNTRGDCDEGYLDDCSGDGDCCPESWIGDGYQDCEDPNNYGCDLTCYDNDGGDCEEAEEAYCGDGVCNGDESENSCPDDCANDNPDECPDGYLDDCSGDGDCCPESWIGDGYQDCEDQPYGCDLTCYDNDGGDCDETEDPYCGDGLCNGDETDDSCPDDCANDNPDECPEGYVEDCSPDDDCCPESWIGDGYLDCEDQLFGCDLTCYDNDGGDCDDYGDGNSEAFLMIGESTGLPGEVAEVALFYESTVPVAGIQFTISDNPDWIAGFDLVSTFEDCFEASFNDINGEFIGILFSMEGCELNAAASSTHFATIVYEVNPEAEWASEIELNYADAIVADSDGNAVSVSTLGAIMSVSLLGDISADGVINVLDVVSLINFILFIEEPSDYEFWAGNINEDLSLNILDVVLLIDIILGN